MQFIRYFTSFGKNLIIQLLLFLFDPTGIIIIFIPLKLLQVKKNLMINYIFSRKAIALTEENNQKTI